jgi:serum/glucocorticoid-regulated kinase 2
MYIRVLQDELQFPDDRAIDQDTKSLIRGVSLFFFFKIRFTDYFSSQLLQRVPSLRICEPRIKRHPYFSMMYAFFIFITTSND